MASPRPAEQSAPRAVREGCIVRVRISTNVEEEASPTVGRLLTFVAGAGQAVDWLDEAVLGVEMGTTKTLTTPRSASVHIVAVIVEISEVSPKKLSGVSDQTLKRLEDAAISSTAEKARKNKSKDTSADTDGTKEIHSGEDGAAPRGDTMPDEKERTPQARAEKARSEANKMVTESTDMSGKGRKKLREAVILYHHALHWNKVAKSEGESDFAAKVLGNIALVLGKILEWRVALLYCAAVLEIDDLNSKATFRIGQACSRLKLLVSADRWLQRSVELKPEDSATKRELDDARTESIALLRKTRKAFSETYSCPLFNSPIYQSVEDDDQRKKDTGSLSGFSKGFMG